MGWWSGSKPKYKQLSTLTPEQQQLQSQLQGAISAPGAGGAYGTAADYYRDLLSPDSQTAQAMFAPEQRRFQEQIVPDLAEQFAGMGAGGLSSSGFRNAAVSAGTDLSERLGAIRAQLRQQGAQGLQGIGEQGLRPVVENIQEAGQPGFGQPFMEGVGAALPAVATAFGGPLAGLATSAATNFFKQKPPTTSELPGKGTTSPYGNKFGELPKFGVR